VAVIVEPLHIMHYINLFYLLVASFVPRPVLRDETIEDQQNVIEEMVDEKVECNDDDDVEELEEISAAEPGSTYTVHSSGRLTLVFKNSPHCSPAPSPSMPSSSESKPVDAVRDVRVKLERCDDSDAGIETPSKRSRLEDAVRTSLPVFPQSDPLQRLKVETKDEVPLSEADAAVAGLLECSSVGDDYIPDATNEMATQFEQLQDDLDAFSAESSWQYSGEVGLGQTGNEYLNGVAVADPVVGGATLDAGGGMVPQAEHSDGEVMSAVDSLMADLSQLNAVTAAHARTIIPNGSVYFPAAKNPLTKRTSDASVAVRGSLNSAGLLSDGVTEAVDISERPCDIDGNTIHSSQSFLYSNRTKFATSDLEPDLDAAINSILS